MVQAATKYATLADDLIVEVLQGPENVNLKPAGANWVQKDLIAGKDTLQKVGLKLMQYSCTIRLHEFIMPYHAFCARLETAYLNGEVLLFVYGTGEVVGTFVIEDMEYKEVQHSPVGFSIARDVDLKLLEYAGIGIADLTGATAKRKAFANKLPTLSKLPVLPISNIQNLNTQLSKISEEGKMVQGKATLLQKGAYTLDRFKREVVPAMARIQTAKNSIDTIINIVTNLRNSPSLSAAVGNVSSAAGTMTTTLNAIAPGSTDPTDIALVQTATGNLSSSIGSMGRAAQPMASVHSWWPSNPFIQ